MTTKQKHRQSILDTAVRLFRQQGYAATGLNQIIRESGAPKGSLYYYFPNGKAEIGLAAVEFASEKVFVTLSALAGEKIGAAEIVRRYFSMVGGWMQQSGYTDGSPITTVVLEMAAQDARIRQAAAVAFGRWAAVLEKAAIENGCEPSQASRAARVTIALIEGALIQCRVYRSDKPLTEAAEQVSHLFPDPSRLYQT